MTSRPGGGRRRGSGRIRRTPWSDVPHPDGVIFEFVIQGAYIRVAAVDEATGVEASIIADRTSTQDEMERVALAKLDWVMRGRRSSFDGENTQWSDQDMEKTAPRERSRFDYKT